MPPRKKATTSSAKKTTRNKGGPKGSRSTPASSASSPPIPAAPVNTAYAAIQQRLDGYTIPVILEREGYVMDPSSNFKEIKCYGKVLYHEEDKIKKWVCLSSPHCATTGTEIKLFYEEKYLQNGNLYQRWVGSNIPRHLELQHGIVSSKVLASREAVMSADQARHEMMQNFKGRMDRLAELQWVKMMILCRMPLASTTYPVVRDTFYFSCSEEMRKDLSQHRVVHVITEIYEQVMNCVKHQMSKSIAMHGERIFSMNVDNWKSKNSLRKFMGLRIYFLDTLYQMKTYMLGVREFSPPSIMRTGENGLHLCMGVWGDSLLDNYDLCSNNIFAATTDNAGDVRILSKRTMGANWDWCIPHLFGRVMIYALSKTRNLVMFIELESVKGAVASIRDHTKDGELFQEILQQENEEESKKVLKSTQVQRFMGHYVTLERYYRMYETIDKMMQQAGLINEVNLSKEELVQLLSIIAPLHEISTKAQTQESAYGYRILQKLINERMNGCLCATSSVWRFDDPNHEKEKVTYFTPRVKHTRSLLIEAMDLKFFSRYFHPKRKASPTLLVEAQHFLHPGIRNLTNVKNVIEVLVQRESLACGSWMKKAKIQAEEKAGEVSCGENASNVYKAFLDIQKRDFIRKIQKDVEEIIKNHIIDTILAAHNDDVVEEADEVPRPPVSLMMTSIEESIHRERGNQPAGGGSPTNDRNISRRIGNQLNKYLSAKTHEKEFSELSLVANLPEWIKVHGIAKYGFIVKAMAAYFGIPTSSAGVECDFYFASLLLTKHRMSMRPELVEMLQMIDRNRALVDLSQVNDLTTREVSAVMPKINLDAFTVLPEEEEAEAEEFEMESSSEEQCSDDSEDESDAVGRRQREKEWRDRQNKQGEEQVRKQKEEKQRKKEKKQLEKKEKENKREQDKVRRQQEQDDDDAEEAAEAKAADVNDVEEELQTEFSGISVSGWEKQTEDDGREEESMNKEEMEEENGKKESEMNEPNENQECNTKETRMPSRPEKRNASVKHRTFNNNIDNRISKVFAGQKSRREETVRMRRTPALDRMRKTGNAEQVGRASYMENLDEDSEDFDEENVEEDDSFMMEAHEYAIL